MNKNTALVLNNILLSIALLMYVIPVFSFYWSFWFDVFSPSASNVSTNVPLGMRILAVMLDGDKQLFELLFSIALPLTTAFSIWLHSGRKKLVGFLIFFAALLIAIAYTFADHLIGDDDFVREFTLFLSAERLEAASDNIALAVPQLWMLVSVMLGLLASDMKD